MSQTIVTKVPFDATNVGKCMCPKCPVQAKSQCVSGKLTTIKEALKKSPLKREDIPGVYCSSGSATCKDIDSRQSCICGTCRVYDQYKLGSGKPGGKLCTYGEAK
jgi:hypothetical protein